MGQFVSFQGFRRLSLLFGCILSMSWNLPAVADGDDGIDVGSRFNLRGFGALGGALDVKRCRVCARPVAAAESQ